jgi:hypothetical protein
MPGHSFLTSYTHGNETGNKGASRSLLLWKIRRLRAILMDQLRAWDERLKFGLSGSRRSSVDQKNVLMIMFIICQEMRSLHRRQGKILHRG